MNTLSRRKEVTLQLCDKFAMQENGIFFVWHYIRGMASNSCVLGKEGRPILETDVPHGLVLIESSIPNGTFVYRNISVN